MPATRAELLRMEPSTALGEGAGLPGPPGLPGLPPPDLELSPYTGWTRRHWAALADRLLAAVDRHRSPLGARVGLPGPNSSSGAASDGLEGFARTFLLAGFRVAGERGADPAGLLQRYAEGLAAGTDPRSPEAWPRPDRLGQAKVEAASVALILQLTRPWLWDRLDEAVRERTVDWLATVIGQPYPPINWVWFRVVVESFLREVGGPWSVEDLQEDLAVHASLRRPGGWLSDGQERAYDHYTGWALHLYPLLWTELFDVEGTLCPPSLRARWAADLDRYLHDAVALTGTDGSPLLQGRSLVYRFAAAAPLWAGALTGTDALPPGLLRRAASGIARHFTLHGVPDEEGLLTLGWHRAWPGMRQSYSGPASPYWAAKGMLGLALPEDHPVWTERELPLPAEEESRARAITAPGWLAATSRADGIALVLNHGTDHAAPGSALADSPLYARLGYSTATVPPLTGPSVTDPVDNTVTVLDAEGRAAHRTGFTTLYVRELPGGVLTAASQGRLHWIDTGDDPSPDHGSGRRGPATPGPVLTVASVLRDGVEIRLARLDEGTPPGAVRAESVRLGGWPVADDERPRTYEGREGRGNTGEASGAPGTPPSAAAATASLHSEVLGLRGFHAHGTRGVHTERGTSPLGEWTAVPWLGARADEALGEVLVARVTLTGHPAPGGPGAPAPSVHVQGTAAAGGHRVTLRWADGTTATCELPPASR